MGEKRDGQREEQTNCLKHCYEKNIKPLATVLERATGTL